MPQKAQVCTRSAGCMYLAEGVANLVPPPARSRVCMPEHGASLQARACVRARARTQAKLIPPFLHLAQQAEPGRAPTRAMAQQPQPISALIEVGVP